MIKYLSALLFISFSICASSQELGYNTKDVGAEYQYTPDFSSFNLLVGFNAKIHHSIIIRGGYSSASSQKTSLHTGELGHGWNASVGYRYHFSVVPKRFFLGLHAGVQSMNITWSTPESEGISKLMIFQPKIEAGYTIVINDLFYITPQVSGTAQTTLSTNGEKVSFGNGFLPGAGISIGWRF